MNTLIKYRADIDGLRAVAIILVIAFHSGATFFSGGFIGVDVFFVISGYLISGVIYREKSEGKFSYANFYARRVRRIAPALIVMVMVSLLFGYFYLSPSEFSLLSFYSLSQLFSVPNIALWWKTNYFSSSSELNPLLMTWSLGVEEQFYVFFPPFVLLFYKTKSRFLTAITLAIFVSLAASIVLSSRYAEASFYLLHTRAWELGAGALLYLLLNEIRPHCAEKLQGPLLKNVWFIFGFCLIFFSAIFLKSRTVFPGFWAILPVLGSMLIIAGNGEVSRIVLSNRVMVFIGAVSYSWYLWHWPLLSFARLSSMDGISPTVGLLISVVAFGIAVLSYKFVETPFRTAGRKGKSKDWIIGYLTISFCCALPMAYVYKERGLPNRVPAVLQTGAIGGDICLRGYGATDYRHSEDCVPTSETPNAIALLGDSHASALRPGVDAIANRSGRSVYELTKSSCPFLLGASRYMAAHPSHFSECMKFNQNVVDFLDSHPNITTIVLSGYWAAGISGDKFDGYRSEEPHNGESASQSAVFEAAVKKTVAYLAQNQRKVALVGDAPLLSFDPVMNTAVNVISLRKHVGDFVGGVRYPVDSDTTSAVIDPSYNFDLSLKDLSAEFPSVRFYSVNNEMCNKRRCLFQLNNALLYGDPQHLSAAGAVFATKDMASLL